jgi:glycine C-acetyltransferase
MDELKARLKEAKADGARLILIATDGVFSMVGDLARLPAICELAEEYDAMVMVDESHATGFIGEKGRGASELLNVLGRVDIITSTFGKALGGASGGFTTGRQEIIELLRQRSRPYLFSNSVPPVVAYTSLKALDIIKSSDKQRKKLAENTVYFKKEMEERGFGLIPSEHPITPIMIGDAAAAVKMAAKLFEEGIYVVGFSYPVVPKGEARIRVQISAAHTKEQIDKAVDAFEKIGKEMGLTML